MPRDKQYSIGRWKMWSDFALAFEALHTDDLSLETHDHKLGANHKLAR